MFTEAITRQPGTNAHRGLTTADLGTPDVALMRTQHAAYLRALESLGCTAACLPADDRFPDGCFIEDVAVVTTACAVIARSGAPSRRGEAAAVAPWLAARRELASIEAPGCLDGGDVVVAGRRVLVGLSARTNAEGAGQLAAILRGHGIRVQTVPVTEGLHLKSAVNTLADDRLLLTARYRNCGALAGFTHVVVPAGEEYAANSLCRGNRVLMPAGFPRARERLEREGYTVTALDVSEFRKMDGGLTCLSIRL